MQTIKKTELCTACTACKHACPVHAIEMKKNRQGFLYPSINENICIKCGKCSKVCPIENKPLLNEFADCYATYNKDDNQRLKSTSGGIFYLLSEQILSEGGLVFGAAYNDTNQVIHRSIEKISDISYLQGAKYVQSELKDTFIEAEKVLKVGRKVLFSGTPCQIAGLKSYLGKEYDNLLTVDLICHGVPSPLAWDKYLEYRKEKDGQDEKAHRINLRSKVSGWSYYAYSVDFQYKNGDVYQKKNGEDPYMRAFVSNMTLRPSCNECDFKGMERCSDFTLGDFWGIWNIKPEMDDNKGTSLVVVHSDKGREYWEKIKEACISQQVTAEDSYRENMSMMKASPVHPERDEVLEQLNEKSFDVVEEKLPELKAWKKPTLIQRIASKIKRMFK